MPAPLAAGQRQAIADDIRAGLGCNATAREHHVSPSTVSGIARDEQLTFSNDWMTMTAVDCLRATPKPPAWNEKTNSLRNSSPAPRQPEHETDGKLRRTNASATRCTTSSATTAANTAELESAGKGTRKGREPPP
ncbi:hypothetical protein ACPW96_20245 [Micromonospora sp. DT81.3]|uniref:hypothetical protein n=1 Tax=Micromonospora sp. DT81.3 TaxID=3416523 RepID=UPI003CF9E580